MGVSAMTSFDYDDRIFVSVDHAGDADPLRGHYHQRGDLV